MLSVYFASFSHELFLQKGKMMLREEITQLAQAPTEGTWWRQELHGQDLNPRMTHNVPFLCWINLPRRSAAQTQAA